MHAMQRWRSGGPLLVTLAAVLWGMDALLRGQLSRELSAVTIVLLEHVVLVAVTGWLLPGAVRRMLRAGPRVTAAAAAMGIGASALATLLFTEAFTVSARTGDFVTPLLLQKVQPLVVILAAWLLLDERPRRAYVPFLFLGLVGVWLIAFARPASVTPASAQAAGLAVGAAILWAGGTVLGRYLALVLSARDITALRFGFGLIGALAAAAITRTSPWSPVDAGQVSRLALLALIPGLAALMLYYTGLRRTPAVVATLCELAFPLTAALVGVTLLDSPALTGSQVTGVVIVAVVVIGLAARRSTNAVVALSAAPAVSGGEHPDIAARRHQVSSAADGVSVDA